MAIFLAFLIRNQNFLILAFSVERLGNTVFPINDHRPGRIKSALICAGCIVLFSSCFSIFELLADKSWIHQLDINFNMTIPFVATTATSMALYKSLKKTTRKHAYRDGFKKRSFVCTRRSL